MTAKHNDVYEAFITDLIRGDISPGDRLGENSLAQRWGVGRVPVREALMRLEMEGVVQRKPKVGTFVREVGAAEMLELYELRMAIEPMVARRVAANATDEQLIELWGLAERTDAAVVNLPMEEEHRRHRAFHSRLAEISTVGTISSFPTMTYLLLSDFLLLTNSYYAPQHKRELHQPDHRTIVQALRTRDGEYAESVMRRHLKIKQELIENTIE